MMFVVKGYLAICEPTGLKEPICILGEGSYFGDFQILKKMPCLFSVRAVASRDVKIQKTTESGKTNNLAIIA